MLRNYSVIVLLLLSVLLSSCVTNYYIVELREDTKLYSKTDSLSYVQTIISKGTNVYITKKKRKKYTKIKYANFLGWTYDPIYQNYNNYISTSQSRTTSSSSSSYKSKGGSVRVKGYTRKDGTYVRPHTRKAPSRRR